MISLRLVLLVLIVASWITDAGPFVGNGHRGLSAADLSVALSGDSSEIRFVGAFKRWDADGNPRRPVDSRARIELPLVDVTATNSGGGSWRFAQIPPGRYDLVLLGRRHLRIEGFHYPPVLEFDPFFTQSASTPQETMDWIRNDIAQGRYYENKVEPLFFSGDKEHVRIFLQLLRDEATSFDAQFGAPVATLRHEVWQYTYRYGAWSKEKRTRVFDRVLLSKDELRKWTWVWVPELGSIEVGEQPLTVQYAVPSKSQLPEFRGLITKDLTP